MFDDLTDHQKERVEEEKQREEDTDPGILAFLDERDEATYRDMLIRKKGSEKISLTQTEKLARARRKHRIKERRESARKRLAENKVSP